MQRLKLKRFGPIGVILFAGFALAFLLAVRTQAQGPELLQNGSFDSYIGSGGNNVLPVAWTLTATTAVSTSKQDWVFNEFPGFKTSWRVSTSKAAFTMTAYQFVPGVTPGAKLRFSAFGNVFTCDKETSCIEAERGYRLSQTESGARTRVGVDPNGGTDPNAASVVWSGYTSPFDRFEQMTVDFEAKGATGVTVFLQATQNVGMLINDVYWDNASLTVGTPGIVPTEVPRLVPFVTPQGQQPDGSVVHVVREGDTLNSIAVAYGVTVSEIRRLNNIPADEFVIVPGQRLLIKPPSAPVTYIVVTATNTPDPRGPSPTPDLSTSGTLRPTRVVTIITLAVTPRQ